MTTTASAGAPLTVLSDEERMFSESVAAFAKAEIEPHTARMDADGKMDAAVIQSCFNNGLMAIDVPEQFGGAGGSFFMSVLAIEELAKVDGSVSVMVDVQNTLFNNAVRVWATPAQQERYFPRLAKDHLASFCLSEWGCGSDAFALKTAARRDGDHYVLNGTKAWITNAGEASLFLVFANVDPAQGYKGITAFMVERDNPGLQVGKREDKLGIRASSTCEVNLVDCRVHKDAIIGPLGKGYQIAIGTLNEGRIGIGAQMVGIAEGALAKTLPYLAQRKAFGQRIMDFQAMQHQYASAATEIEAARLLVLNAARLKDAGAPFVKEAAMAKLYASQVAERVASSCVNMMGGIGFTRAGAVEKYFRDCKIGQIYEGTSNIQLSTIAKIIGKDFTD